MRYFVVTADGQKFGPADVPTLQQWANEGRLLANSMLEEEISGNRVQASAVPGLNLGGPAPQASPYGGAAPGASNPYGNPQQPQNPPGGNPYSQNPYQQGGNYYRPQGGGYNGAYDPSVQKEVTNAWVGGAIGLVCCGPVAIWGLSCANRAKAAGHPGAQAAYIFNIVALVLWILFMVLRFAVLGSNF